MNCQTTTRSQVAIVLFSAGVLGYLSNAAAEPIALEELKQLANQPVPAAQLLDEVKARGLGFEITLPVERELRRSGFSREVVDSLKNIKQPAPGPAVPDRAVAKPELEPGQAKLDPAREAEYAEFDKLLDRIVKNSRTSLVKVRSDHITVVSEKELSERFLNDVKHLEQLFAKQFPAPLGTGPDARKAVIVLTRTRYDYENYMRSLFEQFKADGRQFTSPNAEESALAASHIMLDGMAVSCLEDATIESSRHQVAYGVGYHYMNQLTDGKAPTAILAGFGNYAEMCLMRQPSVRLTGGYSPRDLNQPQDTWANLAKKQLAEGKVSSLRMVMNYDTSAMQTEDYAVCWSFVTLLTTGENQFAKLVAEIRDGGDPIEQVKNIYGLEEKDFLAKWKSFAAQQR